MFPGQQGGPLEHVIAAKAITFRIAMGDAFKERQQRTLDGARVIAEELLKVGQGVDVVTAAPTCTSCSSTCATASSTASRRGPPPRDRHHGQPQRGAVRPAPPMVTSGLRIGTPALATRGLQVDDFRELGDHRPRADARLRVALVGTWPPGSARSPTATRSTRVCAPRRSSRSHTGAAAVGSHLQALLAALVALGVTAAVTPLAAGFARLIRAIDQPRGRGLAAAAPPLLGGIAMLIGIEAALFLSLAPFSEQLSAVAQAAIVITVVGALDDRFDLLPGIKLVGQVAAAILVVDGGVVVDNVTIPFIGPVVFGGSGAPLTVLGLVAVMNIVNFSDGIDGLAAGVTAIAAIAFAIVAFDLGKVEGGTLAAITAGAALGS